MKKINVHCDNTALLASLHRLITQYGLAERCRVCGPKLEESDEMQIWLGKAKHPDADRHVQTPLRIGDLLDIIRYAGHNQHTTIGPYRLAPDSRILEKTTGHCVSLTETEVKLITALAQAGNTGLERTALLTSVWGYRADLDTHTLETHIYRLRQKIEHTPAMPKIILKTSGGYRLAQGEPDE